MDALLIGKNGLLGQAVHRELLGRGHYVYSLTRPAFDFNKFGSVQSAVETFDRNHPGGVVINCAALTDIDACEQSPRDAMIVNRTGPRLLAELCALYELRLIHVSTDAVFGRPCENMYQHREDDAVIAWPPVNVYGQSKAEGEAAIRQVLPSAIIARVQWLHGPGRPNFVTNVIEQAKANAAIRAATDYVGVPSFTGHVAQALINLMESPSSEGVYHLVNDGYAVSRYDLAQEVLKRAGLAATVEAVSSADLINRGLWRARRASRSLLTNNRTAKLPHWQEGLDLTVGELSQRSA